ncbi:hypothetical protein GCM10011322_14180 [Salinarimonas ramus]|uniref:Uncharacterized protein n=1 Tax=Salinarimonas ramus TaxID=690164 RepID=A0A917Q5F7_9HYPH|nr:hypothetical protein GCM10011322_14180 [Salinarimonas ramus]
MAAKRPRGGVRKRVCAAPGAPLRLRRTRLAARPIHLAAARRSTFPYREGEGRDRGRARTVSRPQPPIWHSEA